MSVFHNIDIDNEIIDFNNSTTDVNNSNLLLTSPVRIVVINSSNW